MNTRRFPFAGPLLCGAIVAMGLAVPVAATALEPPKSAAAKALEAKMAKEKAAKSAEDAAKEAAKAAEAERKKTAPVTGAEPKVPGTGSGNKLDGIVGGSDKSKDPAAAAVGASRDKVSTTINDATTQRPGFNQGFADKPTTIDPAAAAAARANAGNPMQSLTGSVVGGPLGAAANDSGKGSSGIASQGKGAISTGGGTTTPGVRFDDADGVKGGSSDNTRQAAKDLGIDADKVTEFMTTGGDPNRRAMLEASKDDGTSPAPATTPQTPAGKDPSSDCKTDGRKTQCADGSRSSTSSDGRTRNETTANGTTYTYVDNKLVGGKRANGSQMTEKEAREQQRKDEEEKRKKEEEEKKRQDDEKKKKEEEEKKKKEEDKKKEEEKKTACPPGVDECRSGRPGEVLSGAGNAQLNQGKSGGSGDIDPDRNDATAGSRLPNAVAPSQSQMGQRLFGNPGQAGGMGESGAPRGLDFNGNAGAIDPGPDATVTSGNRQDTRVEDALGGSPTRDLPGSGDCDADGKTADTADDCP